MRKYVLAAGACAALVAGALALVAPSRETAIALPAFQSVQLADGQQLSIQTREVSIALWNTCFDAMACPFRLDPPESGTETAYPATGLSWVDAMIFAQWLSDETGETFRLPTRSEWHQIAQDTLPDTPERLFDAPELAWASNYLIEDAVPRRLAPAGFGPASVDGVEDLANNVWEWTADCAPEANAARCPAYFAAGPHEAVISYLVRDPARGGCAVGTPPPHLGMRLVLE